MSEPSGADNFEQDIKNVNKDQTPQKQGGIKAKREAKANKSLKEDLNSED